MSTRDKVRAINVESHAGSVRAPAMYAKKGTTATITTAQPLTLQEPYGAINVDSVDGIVDTLDFDGAAADGGDGVLNVQLPTRPNLAQVLGAGSDAGAATINMNDRELQGMGGLGTSNINENATDTLQHARVGFSQSLTWGGGNACNIGGFTTTKRGGSVIGFNSTSGANPASRNCTKIGSKSGTLWTHGSSVGTANSVYADSSGVGFQAAGQSGLSVGRTAGNGFLSTGEGAAGGPLGNAIGSNATLTAIGKNAVASSTTRIAIRLSSLRNMETGFTISAASGGASGRFLELALNGTPYKIALNAV